MSTSTTITIKTPKKLRDAAKRTASKLGIPLTIIMNAQLAQFVSEGRFIVSLTPLPKKVRQWEALRREYDEHPEHFIISSLDEFARSIGV